ncbi:MAG: transposase [Verrucomicrobia bacterium]|nr:transposase [Verrucomicrobiota bacterium]MCL4786826.1 transposase [Verrucomicrobiota bacterium]
MLPDSENPGLDRVRHELRASGVKDATRNPQRSGFHSRGYLPHVKREGAEYFVTFRLADSLPKEVLLRYEAERAERLRAFHDGKRLGRATTDTEEIINRDFLRHVERYLDQGAGACHLRRPEIADLVVAALKFFHERRYVLREWVVMPNHVHVLFWPMPNHLVGEIVKSWKQFTSLRAKRMLGLPEGRFWQPEPFDHWVRDDEERARIARYIRNNPVTARLCQRPEEWRWSSAWREPDRSATDTQP